MARRLNQAKTSEWHERLGRFVVCDVTVVR